MTRACTVLLLTCAACGRFGFGNDSMAGDGSLAGDGSVPPDSPASIYASSVLADTPLAYFHFDELAGPTATSAVGSVTGQYDGTFGFGSPGAMTGSRAVTFDGMTSRVVLGDRFPFAGTAPYSLELWVRPTALATTRFLIDRQTTATPIEGYTVYMGDGYLLHARTVNGSETSYVNYGTPTIGTWMYVVVTWDGSVPRIYIDGVLIAENAGGASTIGGGAGSFVIGDVVTGQFYKLEGDLDELAIYDHALTGPRVAAHYAASK